MADLCISIRGAESLKDELARVKDNLRDTDANIEKLTGRSAAFANRPYQRNPDQPRYNANEGRGAGRGRASLFALANYDNAGPPPAKRPAGPFGRLGLPVGGFSRNFPSRRGREDEDEEDFPHKPAIQSSVVATPKDTKTRKEAIAEQESGGGGSVGQTRNRRMFGLLLGTLNKFREDERTKEDQEVKRKAVEQRLEEKQHEEHEKIVRERQQLFLDRRRQQVKLRTLEQKIELVDMHKAWEAESRNLECFIRTNARPHIFFLPKSHIPASRSKLEESKRILQGLVEERRKQLEEEIEEIMAIGDQSKDAADAEESESENEMDNSTIAEEKKKNEVVKKKLLTSAGGDALSDIDDDGDQAHGGVEYGLSEAVGNIDTTQLSSVLDTSEARQPSSPMAVSELHQDESSTAAVEPSDDKESAMEVAGTEDSGKTGDVGKDRHHSDGGKRHRDRDDLRRSRDKDQKRRDRSGDEKDRRRDEGSSRRHRDRRGHDDRRRDKRDTSRHRRYDDDRGGRKKKNDDRKRDEAKRGRDRENEPKPSRDKENDKEVVSDEGDASKLPSSSGGAVKGHDDDV